MYKERNLISIMRWGPLGDTEIIVAWQPNPDLPSGQENRESARLTVLQEGYSLYGPRELPCEEFLCQTQDPDNPVRLLVQYFDIDPDMPERMGIVVWKEEE